MDGWIANLYKMLGLEKEKATAAQKPLSPDASQEEKISSDGASEQKSSTAAESGAETAVSKIRDSRGFIEVCSVVSHSSRRLLDHLI